MFELSLPWWEFIARASMVYVALLIFVRISGKRAVGEFTPFDFVVLIMLSESAQGALTGGDQSVPGGLLLVATLVGLNYLVAALSARSRHVDRLLEGEPVMLVRHGRILKGALKRENLPLSDLQEALRKAGLADATGVELAMLETNGEITVVKKGGW
jgi:uncharacterized membrane protein YcaP (DUF421 family)